MLFNSYIFILGFLPITFLVYFHLLKKDLKGSAKVFLVIASLFFYSWWNIVYLPIILFSMVFNYRIGKSLDRSNKNIKSWQYGLLITGILINIGILAYFKYADFFLQNINNITSSNISLLELTLPLAISFFTFQQIAYLVDCYRQQTKEYSFLNYALFVTFFPQLIAGPIVHHEEMMPQFGDNENKVKNYTNITKGIFIFSIGLFKKVVIADSFSLWVENGFNKADTLSFFEAWATSLSYTFQLYYDFSGYADMAIGIALLFNIKLPINFNSPYKAISIQDFWRRWHMTLSRFLRDYVYIPLGGNRSKGRRGWHFKIYSNLMMTFIIGGFWHGAGWTFIFWGFLHGTALIIQKIWSGLNLKLKPWLAWFITFNFINISWVFFRAEKWDDAIKVLRGMFGYSGVSLPSFLGGFEFLSGYGIVFNGLMPSIEGDKYTAFLIFCSLFFVLAFKNSNEILKAFHFGKKYLILWIPLLFVFSLLSIAKSKTEFLYFNF